MTRRHRGMGLRLHDLAILGGTSRVRASDYQRSVREADVLPAVREALERHPSVAVVWRNSVGKGRLVHANGESQFISFGFPGLSDLTGFLRQHARFFACECKRDGEKPTSKQQAFLDAVNSAGGIGFVAYSVRDVFKYIPT